jgi:hypothetical protein
MILGLLESIVALSRGIVGANFAQKKMGADFSTPLFAI